MVSNFEESEIDLIFSPLGGIIGGLYLLPSLITFLFSLLEGLLGGLLEGLLGVFDDQLIEQDYVKPMPYLVISAPKKNDTQDINNKLNAMFKPTDEPINK